MVGRARVTTVSPVNPCLLRLQCPGVPCVCAPLNPTPCGCPVGGGASPRTTLHAVLRVAFFQSWNSSFVSIHISYLYGEAEAFCVSGTLCREIYAGKHKSPGPVRFRARSFTFQHSFPRRVRPSEPHFCESCRPPLSSRMPSGPPPRKPYQSVDED